MPVKLAGLKNSKIMSAKEFNRISESLGCKARIAGTKKKICFLEFTGTIMNGYEIIIGIDANRFAQLINPFPALH